MCPGLDPRLIGSSGRPGMLIALDITALAPRWQQSNSRSPDRLPVFPDGWAELLAVSDPPRS